jgi:hypothetical protein
VSIEIGVSSTKKITPNTKGLKILPSRIPNPYHSRFNGARLCGDKSVAAANSEAITKADIENDSQPFQYE